MSKDKKYTGSIHEGKRKGSYLFINDGVNSPPQLNPNIKNIKRPAKELSVNDYVEGINRGDTNILSRAITLIESKLEHHNKMAQELVEKCIPNSGNSIRVGITGVPGVGKSSFIEALGIKIIEKGKKLAVLAVDPSSSLSGGSILGDKTRMEKLSVAKGAFIRPSPAAGSLGGVAKKTHEIIILCEAAGYDTIFIETVGVGQSETTVHNMVDFFLLLMLAGAGDELQGIKRGIMEMADTLIVNKADGNNIENAERAQSQYKNALHLFPPTKSGWIPKVLKCSALTSDGIDEAWKTIMEFKNHTKKNGFFEEKRKKQAKYWMYETISNQLNSSFYNNPEIKNKIPEIEKKVLNGELSSFVAAHDILKLYFKS